MRAERALSNEGPIQSHRERESPLDRSSNEKRPEGRHLSNRWAREASHSLTLSKNAKGNRYVLQDVLHNRLRKRRPKCLCRHRCTTKEGGACYRSTSVASLPFPPSLPPSPFHPSIQPTGLLCYGAAERATRPASHHRRVKEKNKNRPRRGWQRTKA